MVRNIARVGTLIASVLLAACSGSVASPTATATALQATVNTGSVVRLDGGASKDPQGRLLFFEWSFLSVPSGSAATLVDADKRLPSFLADMPGDYVVQLVVSNGVVRSEPVTLTVHVTLCGFSPPNVTVAAAIASVASPPGDTFPRGAVGSFSVFAGDRVTVSAAATSTCSAVSTDSLTFHWTLLEKPAGSTAALNASDLAGPAFFADVQGAYKLQAVVTDRLGNSARSTLLTVTTETCGKNLINASLIDTAGARPFDAHILSVTTSSDDDDVNKCPARFANSYSIGWGAAATPASAAFSFGSTSGSTVTFTPLANASYVVTASVRASSGLTTTAITAVSASCVTGVSAGAVSIAAVAPPFNDGFTRAPGQFFRDDAVTFAAAPISTCQSNPRFTVSFALTDRPVGSAAAFASPTFVADKPGGPYTVQATVSDGIGHSATTSSTFAAGLCGANSINAAILDDTAGTAAPFDRRSLRVVPISTDDDSQRCPARFAQTYSFAWTVLVQSPRPGTLSTPAAQTTIFTPGGSAIYQLQALVTGSNGRSALASIAVDATCSAPFVSATSVGAAFTGQDASFVRSTARVFRDDVVTVSTTGSSACFSPANAGLTYEWTLTRSGSAASINNATASSANFTVDAPSASYAATVVVRDALGNASAPQSATFTASSCGANPIMADVQDLAGAKPFDDHTLTAAFAPGRTTFSDDDDGSKCPTHFAGQYSFTWSAPSSAPNEGFVFDSTHAQSVKFTPGGNAVFNVKLVVSAGTRSAEVLKQVAVSCSDTVPKAGAITVASSTPGFAPGKIFRDDTASLSANPSSLCFSPGSTAYSFLWSLTAPMSSAAHLSSTTAANPTFSVDQPSTTYPATVIVVDKLGNRSERSSFSVTSERCGINPVIVSFAAPTQTGPLPFDPWSALATATSDDDDATKCPARFQQTYPITKWEVSAAPAGASKFSVIPTSGAVTTFREGEAIAGTYTLKATARASSSNLVGTGTQDIHTAACPQPAPTFTRAVSAIGVSATPPAPDPFYATHPEAFFNGDTVNLTAPTTFSCYTSQAEAAATYAWSTSAPPAIAFAPSSTSATPSFLADAANKTWHLRVDVQDHWANSGFRMRDITSGICGAAPITAQVDQFQAPGDLPMDPHILTANPVAGVFFSDDSNPATCPARFAPDYTFEWSLPLVGGLPQRAQLASPVARATMLTPQDHATFTVHLVVRGNGQSFSPAPDTSVNGNCGAPTVPTPSIASINGSSPGSTIFVNDVLSFAVGPIVSNCFQHPIITFNPGWAVKVNGIAAAEPFSPSAMIAGPSFVPTVFNGSYDVSVAVSDGSHQTGSSVTPLTFFVSGCGSAPPALTVVSLKQPLTQILTSRSSPARENIEIDARPPTFTPVVDAGAPGPQQLVPVPFYLDQQMTVTVQVDDASAASACPSYTFTGAALTAPLESTATLANTSSQPHVLTSGSRLTFDFTPDVGDVTVGSTTTPGDYTIAVNVSFGRANAFSTSLALTTEVEGRCGRNTPVPQFVVLPPTPPSVVFTVQATGNGVGLDTFDPDNTLLDFAANPTTGCGLNQTLTYAWAFTLTPDPGLHFVPNSGDPDFFATASTETFTPIIAGDYTVRLVATDDSPDKLQGSVAHSVTVP